MAQRIETESHYQRVLNAAGAGARMILKEIMRIMPFKVHIGPKVAPVISSELIVRERLRDG